MAYIPNQNPISASLIAAQVANDTTPQNVSIRDMARLAYTTNPTAVPSLGVSPDAMSEFKGWYSSSSSDLNKTIDLRQITNNTTGLGTGSWNTSSTTVELYDIKWGFTLNNISAFTSADITIYTDCVFSSFRCHWEEYFSALVFLSIYKNDILQWVSSKTIDSRDYDVSDSTDNSETPTQSFFENNTMVHDTYVLNCSSSDNFRIKLELVLDASNAPTKVWNSDDPFIFGKQWRQKLFTNFCWTVNIKNSEAYNGPYGPYVLYGDEITVNAGRDVPEKEEI